MKNVKKKQLKEQKWNQWFAGLMDADGCLLLSKAGYTSLELTMGLYDEKTLLEIKQKLNGSIKIKSGANAFRYRLHDRQGILKALKKLNGECQNSKRIPQLKKLCEKMNVPFEFPKKLTLNNAWFAGFFDGDGTIHYYFKNGWPQLTISVSNKKYQDCIMFQEFFNGSVYLDKSCQVHKWQISNIKDILFFKDYLKKYPLRSHKQKRIRLIPLFLKLRQIKAYNYHPTTKTYKIWQVFENKWFRLDSIAFFTKKN